MRRLSVVLLASLAVAGCKKQEQAAQPQGTAAAPGAPEGGAPAAALQGKIVERLDAPPYSYLKLKTAQGEEFFIRTGASSPALPQSHAHDYIGQHFR